MKKKDIVCILIAVIAIVIVIIGIKLNLKKEDENENNTTKVVDMYDKETIHAIQEEINATADTEMYQIQEEYDGRKILQIKPSIQLETVLAGILKNGQPSENEIQNILKNKPTQNGVWIAKPSREDFLKLLKDNGIHHYAINEEGYLYATEEKENEKAKELKEAIHSNPLYVISISGVSYIRDDFSGEIVEYPFENMDPYQAVDVYQEGNITVLEITTNEKEMLTQQEILQDVLLNMKN